MTATADPSLIAALTAAANTRDADRTSLLQRLVALQACGEAAVIEAAAEQLAALGGSIDILRYDPATVPLVDEFAAAPAMDSGEREALIARFPGRGGGRSLLIFAHPDSEPLAAGDWRHDPFAGEIADGRLHGWGVADDLSGVAAAISAIDALREARISLAGDLIVAITPSKRHARGIAAALASGVSADGALYLHPAESGAGLGEIKAFASGLLEFAITVAGSPPPTHEPSHTAFAHQAANPIDAAMVIIAALKALDRDRAARIHHPRLEAAVGRSTNILVASVMAGDRAAPQRVPQSLRLTGSVSFPPNETIDAVKAEISAAITAAADGDPFLSAYRPKLCWLSGVSGSDVADDHLLLRIAADAILRVAGIATQVNPMHTSSDIRNPLVQKGIPAIGLGPLCGDLTHAGGSDEWVDVADHGRTVIIAAAITAAWCGIADAATGAAR